VAADLGFERLAGVDISVLVAIVLAALLYLLFLALYPEPRAVYGADGPRLVHAKDVKTPPIRAARR
jgi:hypothetical protein